MSTDDSPKYKTVRPLGRGGMGEVYLAQDLRLDRPVAIKRLRADLASGELEQHLRAEAKLLARLNHPNIVQIYDIIEQEGSLALVMEFIDGHNLHIALREGRGNYSDRLRWLSEVAAGLASAHQAGVVHRDLKLENVLLGEDGVAKVSDFGIGQRSSEDNQLAMSEDVAALGVLAGKLLDGAQDVAPTVRYTLDQLVDKRSAHRPSAEEAARQLRLAWLESTQEETEPPDRLADTANLRISGGLLVLLAVTLLAGGLAGSWWYWRTAPANYIAILPPVLEQSPGFEPHETLLLLSTVNAAMRESAGTTPGLVLVSAADTAEVSGDMPLMAAALGVDELVSSRVSCVDQLCNLVIERLRGEDGTVIALANTGLIPEAASESYTLVQAQWPKLFPGSDQPREVTEIVEPDVFDAYLELYVAAYNIRDGSAQEDVFTRLEALLERGRGFLPLYRLYVHSALDMFDETGDMEYLDGAEAALDSAGLWSGESVMLHRGRFSLAIERQDYDRALAEIDQLKVISSDTALLDSLSAKVYEHLGDFEKADRYYRRALSLRPNRIAYINAASGYYHMAKPQQAIELLQKSLALYPQDARALQVLGMIELEAGSLDRAYQHFQAALALKSHAATLSNLGLVLLLQGEYTAARVQFLEAVELGSRDPVLLLNLADAESLLGNPEAAQSLYREITLQNEGVKLFALSQAYAHLGEYDRAIATLKRMETEDYRYKSERAFNSALVYTLAGQYIAAMVEVKHALNAGFSARWFTLPFFDPLCEQPQYAALLAQAGAPADCPEGISTDSF